jgi:Ca2+-binding RTX toxin-like protein
MYTRENIEQFQGSLEAIFDNLKTVLNDTVFSKKLPLIGSGLSNLDNFIDDIKSAISSSLEELGEADNVEAADLQQSLSSALSAQGLDVLQEGDITFTQNGTATTFTVPLSKVISSLSESIGFDLGLPGLGLSLSEDSMVELLVDFDFDLNFTVDTDGSLTIDTNAIEDIILGLSAAIPNFKARGKLGFLGFNISDEDADDNDEIDPTSFEAAISIDIESENDIIEIKSAIINGNADINLNLAADLGTSVIPGINTDLNVDWAFAASDLVDSSSVQFGEVDVAFNNVAINVGSFFGDFVGDIFGEVQKVTDTPPIRSIVDVLQARVPVLDDLGRSFLDINTDGRVSLRDIVGIMQPDSAAWEFIDAIVEFIELINKIPKEESGLLIPVGDFLLSNVDELFDASPDGGLNPGSIGNIIDEPGYFLGELQKSIDEGSEWAAEALAFFEGSDGSVDASNSTGLSFPIIDLPRESAFRLLLGQDVDLFRFDVPELGFQTGFEVYFPILGPLGVNLAGELGAGIDITLGYSTRSNWVNDNDWNSLNGFWIGPDEPNEPVANIFAGLDGFATIDAIFVSFGVGGGVNAGIGLFLNNANDGKVYLDKFNPSCIFEPISGSLAASLSAFIKIGFGPFGYKKRFNLAKKTLLSFEINCNSDEEPSLAAFDDKKPDILYLHVGGKASNRSALSGEAAEFFTVRPSVVEGVPDGLLVVSAFGVDEDGLTRNEDGSIADVTGGFFNPSKIVAKADDEDDIIVIADEVLTAADIDGGKGEDQIYGGSGHDTLRGGDGEDYIHGGVGNDFIEGGDKDDVIIGGIGADFIDGGNETGGGKVNFGDQTSYIDSPEGVRFTGFEGGSELPIGLALPDDFELNNRAFFVGTGGYAEGDILVDIEYIEGTHYDDVLRGDKNSNTFEGFGGNDQLFGGGGDDFLIGGAGGDILDGGEGDGDRTTYLPSPAAVYIDLTRGLFRGGDANGDVLRGIEHVQGSAFDDFLRGNFEKNELSGYGGDDTIVGGADGDTLDGGDGTDWLSYRYYRDPANPDAGVRVDLKDGEGHGKDGEGHGNDTIARIQEPKNPDDPESELIDSDFSTFENLEGSLGDDELLAGDIGDNIIKGLAGNDVLKGEAGNDTLIGGEGADQFYGGDGLDLADYSDSPQGVRVDLGSHIANDSNAPTATGGHAEGDTFEHNEEGRSTVENLLGTDFDDQLTGDAGNNNINPGLSGSIGDQVDGGGGGGDRLILDYSLNDIGTGISGGYVPIAPSFPTNITPINGVGSFTRRTSNGSAILDQVSFSNIESLKIIGTTQNDSIRSGEGDDIIVTGAGDDYIYGGLGSNRIYAGDGDDTVVDQRVSYLPPPPITTTLPTNTSNPVIDLDGGAGIDTLSVSLASKDSNITLEFSEDFASNSQQQITVEDGTVSIRNFEILDDIRTGDGNDKLAQFGRFANRFSAGDGEDEVNPGLGIDFANGGGGNNDLLILDFSIEDIGTGVQYLDDFDSDELPDFDAPIDLNERPDLARESAYDQFPPDVNPPDGNSFYVRGTADGEEVLDEIEFENFERFQITGTGKNDGLVGGDRDDILIGGDGDDILVGNLGNDEVNGGDGDDILLAAPLFDCNSNTSGDDVLTGGAGADQFWITDSTVTSREGFVTISDFNPDEGDVIHLYARNHENFGEASKSYDFRPTLLGGRIQLGIFYQPSPDESPYLVGAIQNRLDISLQPDHVDFHKIEACVPLDL